MIFYSYILLNFLITYFLINLSIPFLNKYLVDAPELRSSHSLPTPTGAGIVFALTTVITSFLINWKIPIICLPLSVIGFFDDKFNISRFIRYGIQIFTASLILKFSYETNNFLYFFKDIYFLNFILIILLTIFITSIINFTNFMDGIDGLIGSTFFIAFLFLSITYDRSLIFLTSGILAFLIFNWHPAKVFMGDAGSTFLGAVYAGVILEDGDIYFMLNKLLILSPILMDSFFTLIRRMINKQSIFKPHKLHLYQRLQQVGKSPAKVSLIYSIAVLILCLVSLFENIYLMFLAVFLVFYVGLYLSSIAEPFKKDY